MNKMILFALIMAIISWHADAGEFAVSPMLIDFETSPRQSEEFSFEVFGREAGRVRVFMSDMAQQATGHMAFMELDADYSGMADWVELSETEIDVATNERVVINGRVNVPADAKGSYLAAVMVEEIQDEQQAGFNVNVRYAIILNLYIEGRKARLESQYYDLALEEQDGNLFAVAWFENQSETDAWLESEVQIRDENNRLVTRVPLRTQSAWQRGDEMSRVFPNGTVKVYGPVLANVESGTYSLTARNRFGDVPMPSTRVDFAYQRSAAVEVALEDLLPMDVAPVKIQVSASGTGMSRFEMTNPYNRPIEIEFSPIPVGGEEVQFMPSRLSLEAGASEAVRLVQRWGENTPMEASYKAVVAVGSQNQEIEIQTQL